MAPAVDGAVQLAIHSCDPCALRVQPRPAVATRLAWVRVVHLIFLDVVAAVTDVVAVAAVGPVWLHPSRGVRTHRLREVSRTAAVGVRGAKKTRTR